MKTRNIVLLSGVGLLILGCIICGLVFALGKFNINSLNTEKLVTKEFEITEKFEDIKIKGDVEDIEFIKSDDGTARVVCREREKEPHNVRVESNTLTIDKKSDNSIHLGININTESTKVSVYLPEGLYGKLNINSDTGDVTIPETFTFGDMDIDLDTGDAKVLSSCNGQVSVKTDTGKVNIRDITAKNMSVITQTGDVELGNIKCEGSIDMKAETAENTLTDVTCSAFTSKGDTSDLSMTNVISTGDFKIERSTGDVSFDKCDAESIYIKTDTGDVSGNLLSEKVFITDTDTGHVDVPKSINGGRCEITTDTGDIKISTP